MPTIQAADIPDLVVSTLRELGRGKVTDNMSKYRRTIALKRIFRDNKMTVSDGYEMSFNVLANTGRSARGVGLAERDSVSISNVLTTGTMPWRHWTYNWGFDQREPIFNSGPSQIVDEIKYRRISELGGAIEYCENKLWRVQPTTNTVDFQGIPYFVTKSASEGFNGTVPSGHTAVAGINSTTYPRWANWTAQYTDITKADLVRKMRKAARMTYFEPLVEDVASYNLGDDYGFYTNDSVYGYLEEMLEAQNESLGSDIASMDGKVMFRRVPVVWVQELDDDTTNPVYGLNWGVLKAKRLRGWWMRETVIPNKSDQHTVTVTHTDSSMNMMCEDRRRQFVVATGTTDLAV